MLHGETVHSSSRPLVACAHDVRAAQGRLRILSEALNGSWHGSEMVPVNDATSSIGGQLHALERELRALAEDMDHEAGAVRAEMAAEAERVEAERTKAEAQKTAEQQAKRGAR